MGRVGLSFSLKDVSQNEGENPVSWVQIFKFGDFVHPRGDFTIDETFADQIIANFEQAKQSLKDESLVIPVDYNHQSLSGNGPETTKAGGWVKDLKKKTDGIYAQIEWTKTAAEYIRNKEFKFISPEFNVKGDKDEYGNKIDGPVLHAVALTTRPFLKGMDPVQCSKSRRAGDEILENGGRSDGDSTDLGKTKGEDKQMKEKLSKIFRLEGASEDDLLGRVTRVLEEGEELRKALELKDGESAADKIKALKLERNTLSDKVAGIETTLKAMEADKLVASGKKERKIAPAQEAWAKKYALQDPEGFKVYLEGAPKHVEFGVRGSGKADESAIETGDANKDLNDAILAVSNDKGITFEKALEHIKATKPELVRKAYAGRAS